MLKSIDVIVYHLENHILPNIKKEMETYPSGSEKRNKLSDAYYRNRIELEKLRQERVRLQLRSAFIDRYSGALLHGTN